jgi:hypothetical protein
VLPEKTLTVPGRFPLDSGVLYIPFRNGGREPLVVRSIKKETGRCNRGTRAR